VDRAAPQVEVRPATAAEVLPFVVLAGDGAPRELCEQIAAAGYPVIVCEDGAAVFGLVLEPCGPELVITAAGGASRHFDLTRAGFAIADIQAEAFSAIRFQTRRRGLVRKAALEGYTVTDHHNGLYNMRKKLQ
jgi:hypothetical protein